MWHPITDHIKWDTVFVEINAVSVIMEPTSILFARFWLVNHKISESLSQGKMETFSSLPEQKRPQSAGVRALRRRTSSYLRGYLPGTPHECEAKYVANGINSLQFIPCQLNFTNLHSELNTKYCTEMENETKMEIKVVMFQWFFCFCFLHIQEGFSKAKFGASNGTHPNSKTRPRDECC